jgi:20S proteasome alpha/beta subunit
MKRLEFNSKQRHNRDCLSPDLLDELPEKPIESMTQIIGIVCQESDGESLSQRDAVVIACESQYTTGNSKTTDAQKLSIIEFKNGQALIAEAGPTTNSARAVRYISEAARETIIETEYSVSGIIEQALKKIRNEMLVLSGGENYPWDEKESFFKAQGRKFGLMAAYFHGEEPIKKRPHLVKMELVDEFATHEFPFASLGSAASLTDFIFKKITNKKLRWEFAIPLAIHVIEQVKDINTSPSDVQFGWR